jgi:hypothetical protein
VAAAAVSGRCGALRRGEWLVEGQILARCAGGVVAGDEAEVLFFKPGACFGGGVATLWSESL